jgi:hypothetical protein
VHTNKRNASYIFLILSCCYFIFYDVIAFLLQFDLSHQLFASSSSKNREL